MAEQDAGAEEPLSSFETFADAYRAVKNLSFAEQLDPASGTALVFADICAERAQLAEEVHAGILAPTAPLEDWDVVEWNTEKHTWGLIQLLFAYAQHIYETPLDTVQRVLDADPELMELKIIREWLQDLLPVRHAVEVRKGYMPFTKNDLRANKRVQTLSGQRGNERLAEQLDPDAATRGPGTWDVEDANYEKALLRNLFEYVRAGELDKALYLCVQASQMWRAASLRGALFYHDPLLSADDANAAPMGDRFRGIWRHVANKTASNTALDPYERALYGCLCGNLGSVLNVSHTWEERLWGYINARFEQHLDQALASATPSLFVADSVPAHTVKADSSAEASEGLESIFEQLLQSDTPGLQSSAVEPYHIAQRAVITNHVPDLVSRINARLSEMEALPPAQYARYVRFFAHLVLYCHLVHMPLPISLRAPILNAYVSVLQRANQSSELIALYASSLDTEDAHVVYAEFLCSMDGDTPLEDRRNAILQAQPYGLDPAIVARCAVDMIFAEMLPQIAQQGMTSEWDAALGADERRLVLSIDWLTFFDATFPDAVLQTNRLLRIFMVTGRLHAAHRLLQRLPHELLNMIADLGLPMDQLVELDHWRSYFDVLDKNVVVRGLWADLAKADSRTEQHEWLAALRSATEAARIANMELLELGWLHLDIEAVSEEEACRIEELTLVRRRYIPEIVFSLHLMLVDTSQVIPENLAYALGLSNMVADERLRLYAEFSAIDPAPGEARNMLRTYLEHVREAALLALDRHEDVFGCDKRIRAL
ncbi:Nup84p [Malassezia vespertilionis]|uniref:Nuclear pore complex protein n=1 Tax=Malassezia vespertilionis TaxID=2020962 RepID=A0A2N1JEB5_9BASI|nr:Nup84p [Malassezia vespertilionis]